MDIKLCGDCQGFQLTSKVYYNGGTTTLLGGSSFFWDEEGRAHHHNMNRVTEYYNCSNGHKWSEIRQDPCWCQLPEDQDSTQ